MSCPRNRRVNQLPRPGCARLVGRACVCHPLWSFQQYVCRSKLGITQGRQDSNPQHAALETAALPVELHPYATVVRQRGIAARQRTTKKTVSHQRTREDSLAANDVARNRCPPTRPLGVVAEPRTTTKPLPANETARNRCAATTPLGTVARQRNRSEPLCRNEIRPEPLCRNENRPTQVRGRAACAKPMLASPPARGAPEFLRLTR